jgi:RimJ/RimL family protein N-acetyltransferase
MAAVTLRVPTAEDALTWCELFDDPDVMRYIGTGARRDRAYYVGLVERQQQLARATELCLFSALVEGRVIGFAGVQPWSSPWGPVGRLEIGWRLGRQFWGRGHATAAGRAALERARAVGVEHLVALIQQDNSASFGVARRLGMTPEEVLVSPEGTSVHQLGVSLLESAPAAN